MTDTRPPQTGDIARRPGSPFDGADVIYAYTRANAIADGILYDVGARAKEAGIKYPVCITAAVHSLCRVIPEDLQGVESYEGRLWDVLWMFRFAAGQQEAGVDRFTYRLLMNRNEGGHRKKHLQLAAIVGPDDNGEPVITIGTDWSDLD